MLQFHFCFSWKKEIFVLVTTFEYSKSNEQFLQRRPNFLIWDEHEEEVSGFLWSEEKTSKKKQKQRQSQRHKHKQKLATLSLRLNWSFGREVEGVNTSQHFKTLLRRHGTLGYRWQPISIQFDGKDGIGYLMSNQLDGKIGIAYPMHRVIEPTGW